MKLILCVLASFTLTQSALAQSGTAVATLFSRSLALRPTATLNRSGGASYTLYFTTYDGRRGLPLAMPITNGLHVSSELRPRRTGVYETDYAFWSGGYISIDGMMLLRLPVHDFDGDRLPDLLELDRAYYPIVRGTATNIFPNTNAMTFDGRFVREANARTGAYSGTLIGPGASFVFNGVLENIVVQGEALYVRGATNEIVFQLTRTNFDGSVEVLNGATSYKATSNTVLLPRFTLISETGDTYLVLPATLQRYRNRYVGSLRMLDGALDTPWPDYVNWIIELTDPLDSDQNRVPDLSDPSAIPDTLGPVLSILAPLPGARVSSPSVVVRGTAKDRSGVQLVEYGLESAEGFSGFLPAAGTTNWNATVEGLTLGTNRLWLRAVDDLGNVSPEKSRAIVFR